MIIRLFILSNIFAFSTLCHAQESYKRTLDSLIHQIVQKYQVPSLSVVVCNVDSAIYANAYGVKRKGTVDSVNLDSKYYWASVSKVFTASAIMKLKEQDKLQIDDFVIKHYPEFSQLIKKGEFSSDSITIRHLLSHSSGLPKFNRNWLITDERNNLDLEESLSNRKKVKLSFKVGSDYQYSNMGMGVLGVIIERTSALSYIDYIRQNIFYPLQLSESTFDEVNNLIDTSIATPHIWSKKQGDFIVKNEKIYTKASTASGGLKMSPNDMSKWLIECMKIYKGEDGFIKQSTLKEMWSQYKTFNALGWDFEGEAEYWGKGPYLAKGGNLEYMSDSYFVIIPDRELAISISVNATSDGFDGINGFANQIIEMALKI
jgi:CubicO group peptidase (beta-lactamase class C family)